MFEMKCPNCGAPLRRGWQCEYCGSVDSENVLRAVECGLLTPNQAREALGLEPVNGPAVDELMLCIDTSALARAFDRCDWNPARDVVTPQIPTKIGYS